MSEGRVYIPCSCDSGSEGAEEANEYISASIDGRAKRMVARGRCIWQLSKMLIQLMCYLSVVNSRLFGTWQICRLVCPCSIQLSNVHG
jgi:hypothetical protein